MFLSPLMLLPELCPLPPSPVSFSSLPPSFPANIFCLQLPDHKRLQVGDSGGPMWPCGQSCEPGGRLCVWAAACEPGPSAWVASSAPSCRSLFVFRRTHRPLTPAVPPKDRSECLVLPVGHSVVCLRGPALNMECFMQNIPFFFPISILFNLFLTTSLNKSFEGPLLLFQSHHDLSFKSFQTPQARVHFQFRCQIS